MMKKTLIIAGFLVLSVILAQCGSARLPDTAVPRFASVEPTQEAVLPPDKPATSRCKYLWREGGLPVSGDLEKSHIVYIAASYAAGAVKTQAWVLAIADGSERLLLERVPERGIGFLSDGYHYLVVGARVMKSDLSGAPLEEVDPSDYIENFPRYSPMWNLIARDPEAYPYPDGWGELLLYSPDGKHFATWQRSSKANTSSPLVIQNKESGEEVEVFRSGPGETILGNWSPDGQHFVFTWYENAPEYYSVVYTVNADGSGLHPLTEHMDGEILERPRWSPDGRRIALPIWGRYGNMDIMILDYPTGGVKRFGISPSIRLSSIMDQGEMAWSPDGRWLAYISEYGHYGIEILNVENGEIYCGRDTNGIEMMDWK